ncbi:MAG TPA: N-acetylmuramoyl-L-alanine amidase [Bacteroidetes bacterium]|nr:N-acetylmuramoyl-L-alanine amidase [Bacteroidota bacterium]
MNILKSVVLSWVFVLTVSFTPDKVRFFKAEALPGDGVFSLLRRYDLDNHSCNHSKFYEINNLKRGAHLKIGKTYSLPILIYRFDGKTIRSSIGIRDWDTAKKIEAYNDKMLADGYRTHSFKKNKILWVPYHLLHCPKEDIPVVEEKPSTITPPGEDLATKPVKGRNYPIFGEKYAYTPLKSRRLAGQVFYIESGHGGPDPGAVAQKGKHKLCEDEYAYDVALRLVRNLVAHGATAYMITRDPNDGIRDEYYLQCDNDEVTWGNLTVPAPQKPRLFQRSNVINELYEKHKKQGVKNQKLIVIHVDSRGRGEQTDLYFYYHPSDPAGKKLAVKMHRSMEANYKKYRKGRGYKGRVTSRDLHMLRETKVPSAYIEIGNIRHPTDQQRIILPRNRQLLADWLFQGVLSAK